MPTYRLYNGVPISGGNTRALIDTDALKRNYQRLCAYAPHAEHIAVVKADAYGHGIAPCVGALLDAGCAFFATASFEEAISVRRACDLACKRAEILIFGYTSPTLAEELAEYDFLQTVLDGEHARELDAAARAAGVRVRAHIAVDTGMNRIGLSACTDSECKDAARLIGRLCELEGLSVEGIFTHFAQADEEYGSVVGDGGRTSEQIKRFAAVRRELSHLGRKLFSHAANSAASVRLGDCGLDAVRLGIMLYGASPSANFETRLEPVMTLETQVVHIHALRAGEPLGYGGAFVSDTPRVIATLPIGYGDGFLRAYGGFCVTVHTSEGDGACPVVGKVCMDQCMIDVTDTGASVGDRVTVFGGGGELSCLAAHANMTEYECLCSVSARVPRVTKK